MRQKLSILNFLALLIFNNAWSQTGQWSYINSSNTPTTRQECTYVQAGSKFYLLGGRGNLPVESYDLQTNSWSTETSSMPFQMHHFEPVEYNGKIYIIGAFTGNCCHETPVANVYIYDPVTKQFNTGPVIPTDRRRGAAGCVLYNNKFYLVCGIIDGHTSGWVPWLDVFDPVNNTWTQLPDAPRARDHFYAIVVNGKIYCIGGRRSGYTGDIFKTTTPEVDIFDIASNTWSTLPASLNIPTQRAACATALLGDEILVMGGEGAQIAYDVTEAFNTVTQSWRTLAPMNHARHGTTAIAYNNNIYVACGAGARGGSTILNTQEVFSFTGSNITDCNGVVGGSAFPDDCGVCSGGTTNHEANSDKDLCGVCFGNNSTCKDCNGVPKGSALLDDCGICSGGNTGHVANSDKDACGVCFGNGSSCSGTCQPLEVVSFTLMKTGTAGEIGPLTNGMTINLATIGQFSIRANTCNGLNVGSVKFILNGATVRTESAAPYAINGDNNGSFIAWNTTTGSKTLTGIPYSQSGGGGTAGISEAISFIVVNQASGTPDCSGVAGGTAILDACGVCSGGNTGHVANSDKDACGVCFGNGSSCATPDCNGVAGGSAVVDGCGVCSGGNTGHVANSDKDACGLCFGNGSSCGGTCQPLQVVSLTLVKTGTAGDIGPLTQGMTIYKTTIGNFNIRANICPGSTAVKSVKFVLDGTTTATENTAPYAIAGDSPVGSYKIWNAPVGNHTLVVTPYSGSNGSGTVGIAFTVSFAIVSGAAPKTDFAVAPSNPDNEVFNLYPNPNNGQFMIELEIPGQDDLSIRSYNQLGQTIYSDLRKYSGALKEQFTFGQPSGIYFVQLTCGSRVFNKKIIINK